MRRLLAALASLACAVGVVAAPASPAAADTVTVGQPAWSVALTFPDMQWSSHACQFLPVSAVVTGDVQSWTFGGFVSARDAEDYEDNAFTWFIDYDDMVSEGTGSFAFRHAVMLCPNGYDESGPYEVVGEVGVRTSGSPEWAWLPYRATFTVTGIPTVTTLDTIDVVAGEAIFSGRTVASPAVPASFSGCRSYAIIETEVGADWQYLGDAPMLTDGSFTVIVPTYRLIGSQYRARNAESICASSSSVARALPVRLPTVRLTNVSKDSKLRVDIDPNRGRRAWTFQVLRESSDGNWRKVGSYRTRGSQETRTINLRRGCYRVRVPAQAGYAETLSDYTCLSR